MVNITDIRTQKRLRN